MATARVPEYLKSHVLAGDGLLFSLDDEAERLRDALACEARRGITLAKEDGLSVVMVAMKKGDSLGEHSAAGPMTIAVHQGRIRLRVRQEEMTLDENQLVVFGAGAPHDARAEEDSVLLVTVVLPQTSGNAGPVR